MADTPARNGYRVEQNPPPLENGRKPDYRIEGEYFDCYSRQGSTPPQNVWRTIRDGKMRTGQPGQAQANRFVLNLDGWSGDVNALRAPFAEWPIPDLQEVLVVRGGTVFLLSPRPTVALTYSLLLQTDAAASDVGEAVLSVDSFELEDGSVVAPGVLAGVGSLTSADRLDAYSQSIYLEEKGLSPSVIVTFTVNKFDLRSRGEANAVDAIVSLAVRFGPKAFATYLGDYPVLARSGGQLVVDAGWSAARPELAERVVEEHTVEDLPGTAWSRAV